jgi:hypothetical protein
LWFKLLPSIKVAQKILASAVPIFRAHADSRERSLVAARGHHEPAGQIAAPEMEIVRIKGALQRAEN